MTILKAEQFLLNAVNQENHAVIQNRNVIGCKVPFAAVGVNIDQLLATRSNGMGPS